MKIRFYKLKLLKGEIVKNRVVNILIAVISASFAIAIFVFGVIAAVTQINAQISGTFYFAVPDDAFFAVVHGEIRGHAGETIVYNEETNLAKTNFNNWELNQPLAISEGEAGKPQPIVFTFTIQNKNQTKDISIRFQENNYDVGKLDLVPEAKILAGVRLKSLENMPSTEPDTTTFTITLKAKESAGHFSSANFSFSLIFNFAQ